MDVVTLSRLQFGLTAMYHFLFVPLTLGLSVLLAIMESIYVTTGRTIWRDMVKFWGMLFGINFAMGVATGITMEFQFGTNWAYYAHYVGDIFGAPLAIEGLMAFFLEATFVGLFFFGWERLSRVQHLIVTCLVALGTNLSALWILIANGWMQNPVGARFNLATMRMEVTDFGAVLFNPVAQAKFVHTVSAGYVTGSMFVLAISAFYLLRGPQPRPRDPFHDGCGQLRPGLGAVGRRARRRKRLHGRAKPEDEDRRDRGDVEHRAGAGLVHHRWPARHGRAQNPLRDRVPWVLGLIATRSLDRPVSGINDLVATRSSASTAAYSPIRRCWRCGHAGRPRPAQHLRCARRRSGLCAAAEALHARRDRCDAGTDPGRAWDTVPPVPELFWTFRFMVGLGFYFIALFAVMFWIASQPPA